ncbi:MAG: ABC transporter permease [Nanoarchaeota archaeon]
MKLATMVWRNLRILFRSKTTTLVILLGPLLAVMLATMSFDNDNQYSLKIAAFGESYPRIANQFLEELSKSSFQVDRMRTADDCRNTVREGKHHACMLIEPDSRKSVAITMLVDFSKVNVVDHLLNQISDKVALQSSEISLNLTEALVKRIEMTKEEVEKNRYIITSLTTGQELVGRQLDELNANLAAFDPKIDVSAPAGLVTAIDNGTVDAQFETVNRLKNEMVFQLSSISKDLDEALKGMSMSETDKNTLREIINVNDNKVRKISDEFRATAELTSKDLGDLKDRLNEIIGTLGILKEQLDGAKDAKFNANVQIRKLKGTLDDNLIKIIVLQTALNKIGASVDNLKVSRESVQSPIRTDIQPISASSSRLNMIFPTILVFLVMISCTLLAASLVSSHKQNPGSVRDSLMPVHPAMRLIALFLTVAVLAFVQTMAVLGLAGAILGTSILPGIPSAGFSLLTLISVFSLLGMVLGFAFTTEQGAVLAGVGLTSASLVFSDVLLPIESMPPLVAKFASMNPFVIGTELVRRSLLYHTQFSTLIQGVVLLIVISLGLIVILLFQHREKF